jgi:hypothetical protein
MNEFDLLRQFGAQVDSESDFPITVSARVLQRIRQRQVSVIDPRLSLASVGACVLSAVVIVITWSADPTKDSLASLADAAVMTTGPDALRSVIDPCDQ